MMLAILEEQKKVINLDWEEKSLIWIGNNIFKSLTKRAKCEYNNIRLAAKNKYINKFNWFIEKKNYFKQSVEVRNINKRKTKNMSDYKRYKLQKKYKKQIGIICSANNSTISKSSTTIDNCDKE